MRIIAIKEIRTIDQGTSQRFSTQRVRIGSKETQKIGTTRDSYINDENGNQITILITSSFFSVTHTKKRLTGHQPNLENILTIYQNNEK